MIQPDEHLNKTVKPILQAILYQNIKNNLINGGIIIITMETATILHIQTFDSITMKPLLLYKNS